MDNNPPALTDAQIVNIALVADRLARRMGARFVLHDRYATAQAMLSERARRGGDDDA